MQYYDYYQVFEEIDKSHDRRVSLNEFIFSKPTMERFGLKIDNMEEEFKKIDINGGGFILFDEFADYCIKHSF
jgi:Ca2+-binding EF-hand superfamily protein